MSARCRSRSPSFSAIWARENSAKARAHGIGVRIGREPLQRHRIAVPEARGDGTHEQQNRVPLGRQLRREPFRVAE